MKLSAKQLKALPDSEFGLVKNGKRSYPLVDKNHVRSAIAFFKYAKPEDRHELAKNINRKAKEFNMKIKAGGLFVRYIDPGVSKYDASATVVTDASHIGTLAPIVGATNINTATHPKEAEEIVNLIKDEEIFNETKKTPVQEKFSIRFTDPNEVWRIRNRNRTKTIKSYLSEFDDFDHLLRKHVTGYEIEEMRNYMTGSITNSHINDKLIQDSFTTKILHKILDENEDNNIMIPKIVSLLLSKKERNRVLACLAIVYYRRPDIVKKVIEKFKSMDEIFGEVFSSSLFTNIPLIDNFQHSKGLSPTEVAFFEYIMSYVYDKLVEISLYLDRYFYISNEYSTDTGEYIVFSNTYIWIIQELYNNHKIDGYYSIKDISNKNCNTELVFLKLGKEYYLGKPYRTHDNKLIMNIVYIGYEGHLDDTVPESIFNLYIDLVKHRKLENFKTLIIASDENSDNTAVEEANLAKNIVNKTKSFMKGIHVDDDGNVKFNLTDKLSFEHYEEVHKMIKTSYDSNNIEETKRLLAYIFSVILTIEREYMNEGKGTNKKYINKQDPTYKEMVRLRALYISDFKVYMRKIVAKDPSFKFLDYYNNSDVNRSVYTVHPSDIKKVALAFRMAMV